MENVQTKKKVVFMDPRSIRYTQECISDMFKNGKYLLDTLESLQNGDIPLSNIPILEVVFYKDAYWTLNNRRLWVFQQYGKDIPVQEVEDFDNNAAFYHRKKTANGKSIYFDNGKKSLRLQTLERFPQYCIKP